MENMQFPEKTIVCLYIPLKRKKIRILRFFADEKERLLWFRTIQFSLKSSHENLSRYMDKYIAF